MWGEKHRPLPPLRYGFPLQRGRKKEERKIEKQGLLMVPPLFEGGAAIAAGDLIFAGRKEGGFLLWYDLVLKLTGEYKMVAITFDTLRYANRLKAAGAESKIAEAEAEALAEIFELNLKEVATREDIKFLEERLNERLDTRLLQLEQRMIIKLGGLMVIAVGAVATLVKLL